MIAWTKFKRNVANAFQRCNEQDEIITRLRVLNKEFMKQRNEAMAGMARKNDELRILKGQPNAVLDAMAQKMFSMGYRALSTDDRHKVEYAVKAEAIDPILFAKMQYCINGGDGHECDTWDALKHMLFMLRDEGYKIKEVSDDEMSNITHEAIKLMLQRLLERHYVA